MGTAANTVDFRRGGEAPAVSRGGKVLKTFVGTITMSASYATNGDTLTIPTGEGTLVGVVIANHDNGTRRYVWDGNTTTPKIKGYVNATEVEVANAVNLSADAAMVTVLYFEQ